MQTLFKTNMDMTDPGFFADDERPTMMFHVFLGEHRQQTTPPPPKYKLTIAQAPGHAIEYGISPIL